MVSQFHPSLSHPNISSRAESVTPSHPSPLAGDASCVGMSRTMKWNHKAQSQVYGWEDCPCGFQMSTQVGVFWRKLPLGKDLQIHWGGKHCDLWLLWVELPMHGKLFGVCAFIKVMANQGCSPLYAPWGSCLGFLFSPRNTGFALATLCPHFCDSALSGHLMPKNDQELLAQLPSLSKIIASKAK